MFMNVSLGKTDYWDNTFARGLKLAGYTTGPVAVCSARCTSYARWRIDQRSSRKAPASGAAHREFHTGAFGKTLNGGAGAESCSGKCEVPPHWDKWHVLCAEGYYNVTWNRGAVHRPLVVREPMIYYCRPRVPDRVPHSFVRVRLWHAKVACATQRETRRTSTRRRWSATPAWSDSATPPHAPPCPCGTPQNMDSHALMPCSSFPLRFRCRRSVSMPERICVRDQLLALIPRTRTQR